MKGNMKSIIRSGLMALTCVCLFSLQAVWANDISETHKYAWSENVSWQNWRSTNAQVTVEATYLTGYVWAENAGWIKLGSTPSGGSYANTTSGNWGVNRDASGNLSGYAWSENVGWINFNSTRGGVTINTGTNKFDGYAWGERIGWIHFQNASPQYYVMLEAAPNLYVGSDGDCGVKEPCYDSIQDAVNGAADGSVILVKQGTYEESVTLTSPKTLTVKGGYNSTYTQQTANKTIIRVPGKTVIKATSGTIKLEMVTIRP